MPNHTLSVCQLPPMFAKEICHRRAMPDAQRFAETVLAAFTQAGNRTEAQIAKAEGPSTSTMTKLRKVALGQATMAEPREPTWTKIENAAQWAPGSARKVWDGGEPIPAASDDEIDRLETEVARLAQEIQRLRHARNSETRDTS